MRFLVNGFGAYFGGIVRVHNAICEEVVRRGEVIVANAPRDQVPVDAVVVSRQDAGRLGSFLRDLGTSLRGIASVGGRVDVRIDTAPAVRPFSRAARHVVVVHDLNYRRPAVHRLSRAQVLYRRALHRWTLAHADVVVANSDQTRRELVEVAPAIEDRIRVLPLPVDHLGSRGWPPRPTRSAGTRVRLLTFGHARNKGVDRLLGHLRVHPEAELTVVCTEDQWRSLWSDLARGVADRVTVRSELTDDELVAEYLACDVFCMISTYEGYGLPVAEALALGVPTVTSDLAVLRETGRGYCAVAEDGTAPALARAIAEALATPTEHWRIAAKEVRDWRWTDWVDAMLAEPTR